jgi:hypothetical protein
LVAGADWATTSRVDRAIAENRIFRVCTITSQAKQRTVWAALLDEQARRK